MGWYRKRNEFENGLLAGIIYTGSFGLAVLGFLGAHAYVYHLGVENKIEKYGERIEELEKKVEKCYENISLDDVKYFR
jgi:hypothetical protein